MTGARILVRGGHVLTMDPALGDIAGADVLIEDGAIVAVASDLASGGGEIIDARGAVVLPGFVDTHRHTWQSLLRGICGDWTLGDYFRGIRLLAAPCFTPDDVALANEIGGLEALNAGVTSVLDFSHCNLTPEHSDAALDGFQRSGLRGLHCHGFFEPAPGRSRYASHAARIEDFKRIVNRQGGSALVQVGAAIGETGILPLRDTAIEIRAAREAGTRMVLHTGCMWGSAATAGVPELARAGLLGADQVHVHCNTLRDDEWRLLATADAKVSISPETELNMGMGRLAIDACRRHGIAPTLSVDVVSFNSGDMFGQMRSALTYQRHQENDPLNMAGEMPERLTTTVAEVLGWATRNGAHALGLGETVGTLTPGKRADLIVVGPSPGSFAMVPCPEPVASVVLQTGVSDVRTVIVDGRIRKSEGKLVGVSLESLLARARDASERIVADMRKRSSLPPPADPAFNEMARLAAAANLADIC